jgi:hypothetical protein
VSTYIQIPFLIPNLSNPISKDGSDESCIYKMFCCFCIVVGRKNIMDHVEVKKAFEYTYSMRTVSEGITKSVVTRN